nr:MAG TPA: holin [Caudoviricetes sp.]
MINNRYYPLLTLLVTAVLAAITLILLSNQFFLLGTLAALATVSFEVWKFTFGRIR